MKRAIKERHEVTVPCALSPTGEHRVWLDCDADRRIVRLASECRHEGDAAARLGGVTCRTAMLAVRFTVATRTNDTMTIDRTHQNKIPAGVDANVTNAAYDAVSKRKERTQPKPDTRPLVVRLLQRRARKLSPEFAASRLRVSLAPDGTRNIHAGASWRGGGGDGTVVAQKRRGRWIVEESALATVAKYLGEGENGACLVCKDDNAYQDFQAHGRARAHQAGVLAILRRVVAKLPGGAL